MAEYTMIKRKVFVSYVKENFLQIDKICKAFTENDIEYWLDRKDIDPGKFWKDAIKVAINNGAYFLACFSREYNERKETYMNEELLEAVEILRIKKYNSGWFIPIKLSECEIPPISIGGGRTLNDIHYLSFYEDWATELNRLIDIIKREEDDSSSKIISDEIFEKEYIYLGLKSLIESGSGAGFHNADLGHPVYRIGASDAPMERLKDWEYADSPEKSLLFKMLSRLSKELKQSGIEEMHFIWWYDFSEWRDFCKFVIDVYDKKRGYKRTD
jgi:hypothetical protein